MRLPTRASLVLFAALLAVSALQAALAQGAVVRDLLTAARRGDLSALRQALDRGAAVDATDPSFRQTAVIRAAMFGQAAAARLLVAAKADLEHGASPDGMRALHWAARQGSAEMVRVLVGAGADVNATDGPGTTVLEYGIAAGSAAAVRELLAAGARPEKMRQPLAALVGPALNADVPGIELEALVVVIRAGRGLERSSGHVGEGTALLALAGRANRPGAEQMAQALVAAGADLRATDEKGRTARQIVEAWIPTQRNASYRKNLEAVAAVLRGAEGQR
jgi:ankyrin repeat protein